MSKAAASVLELSFTAGRLALTLINTHTHGPHPRLQLTPNTNTRHNPNTKREGQTWAEPVTETVTETATCRDRDSDGEVGSSCRAANSVFPSMSDTDGYGNAYKQGRIAYDRSLP